MRITIYAWVASLVLVLSACSGLSTKTVPSATRSIASAEGYEWVVRTSRQNPEILTTVLSAAGPGKVVLFDLDDTLIDCQPRSYNLILNFLDLPDTQNTYPDLVAKVKSHLKIKNIGFAKPSVQLGAIGIRITDDKATAAFLGSLDSFWFAHLQANDSFVNFDIANPGAVKYVNAVHDTGATVIYFTGRSDADSKSGTIASLKKLGFPIDDRAFPVLQTLQPSGKKFASDADFKGQTAPRLSKYGQIIAFFDNEPANDLAVRASMPDISVVFVNTNWQGPQMDKLVSDPTILWINNFIPETLDSK